MTSSSAHDLAQRVLAGERRALAQAITLVESSRPDQRLAADTLMAELGPAPGSTLRIGLTGTPGVGKSTFIEAFGTYLTDLGHRVAVLAVDPSSAKSGGSILGDKTRMERLARNPNAFIRPSPSQTELGGVARRTRECIRLCEAAGFDIVLVETVGVGQSETMVAGMTDVFVLLIAPAGGDELQGVKRGILEMADLILVTKSDGDLLHAANRTLADYGSALRLFRRRQDEPEGYPKALAVSSTEGMGINSAWHSIEDLAMQRKALGTFEGKRASQARLWFEDEVRRGVLAQAERDVELRGVMSRLGDEVARGTKSPSAAAAEFLAALHKRSADGG